MLWLCVNCLEKSSRLLQQKQDPGGYFGFSTPGSGRVDVLEGRGAEVDAEVFASCARLKNNLRVLDLAVAEAAGLSHDPRVDWKASFAWQFWSIIRAATFHPFTQGTKSASWCLKNLGDYLKKAQLLGIVYLSMWLKSFEFLCIICANQGI
jgi:hypothetical protein